MERAYARYGKLAKAGGDKEAQRIVAVLDKVRPVLDQARPARSVALSKEEHAILKPLFLLTAKPAGLYSFDLDSKEDAQTLQHVCDLPIRTPVTDAAITPDGARLAVMTVTGPYLFQIDGDVASAGTAQPKRQVYFDLKDLNMEGVCFVEGGLLATTEHGQVLFFKDQDFK